MTSVSVLRLGWKCESCSMLFHASSGESNLNSPLKSKLNRTNVKEHRPSHTTMKRGRAACKHPVAGEGALCLRPRPCAMGACVLCATLRLCCERLGGLPISGASMCSDVDSISLGENGGGERERSVSTAGVAIGGPTRDIVQSDVL
eukprot:8069960-Pyramimonas_sp.AAC.1